MSLSKQITHNTTHQTKVGKMDDHFLASTVALTSLPDSDFKEALTSLYASSRKEDYILGVLLLACYSQKQVVFKMTRPYLEKLLAQDTNLDTDRKVTLNNDRYGYLWTQWTRSDDCPNPYFAMLRPGARGENAAVYRLEGDALKAILELTGVSLDAQMSRVLSACDKRSGKKGKAAPVLPVDPTPLATIAAKEPEPVPEVVQPAAVLTPTPVAAKPIPSVPVSPPVKPVAAPTKYYCQTPHEGLKPFAGKEPDYREFDLTYDGYLPRDDGHGCCGYGDYVQHPQYGLLLFVARTGDYPLLRTATASEVNNLAKRKASEAARKQQAEKDRMEAMAAPVAVTPPPAQGLPAPHIFLEVAQAFDLFADAPFTSAEVSEEYGLTV